MAVRDRVVRWVLVAGGLLALLSWQLAAPWLALTFVIVAIGIASVAYRIEPPRIDLDASTLPDERTETDEARAGSVDQ